MLTKILMTLMSGAKKKKNYYKQFEFFDKTDKKLTVDEEAKKYEESKLTELLNG